MARLSNLPRVRAKQMAAQKLLTPDEQLADAMAEFYADPLGHVMFSYPWDREKAIQLVKLQEPWKSRYKCEFGPDQWACEFLDQLGEEVRKRGFDGQNAVDPVRFATASGHGIGKSVMVAWIIKWIMDTRPYSKGTVTANTDVQLRTKTWATLGTWHKMSMTEHWFDFTTGRGAMALKHKQYGEEWRCTAQTSREENSESFAGQHAANATSFYIFDEASGIPDKIYEVRDGGLVTGEPMAFDFGNPTRKSGAFFEECVGKLKHRYISRCIDSRTVAITNKTAHAEMIADFGIDSDRVKVRILGQFPSAGSAQFINTNDVEAAMARPVIHDRSAQLLIGVDVARFGDDESVIWARLGNDARSFPPDCYSGLDTVALVGKIIEKIRYFRELGKEVSGLFVDGGGVGGGVVDQLRALGYNPIEIQFGGSPIDKTMYRFKSDEMWGRMRDDGIKRGLCLPAANEPYGSEIKDQLTQREFGYTLVGNKINLEPKSEMKARLGSGAGSPDKADALALTYAFPVAAAPEINHYQQKANRDAQDYDPLKTNW